MAKSGIMEPMSRHYTRRTRRFRGFASREKYPKAGEIGIESG